MWDFGFGLKKWQSRMQDEFGSDATLSASNEFLRSREREMPFAHWMGEGVPRTDEGNKQDW